MTVNRVPKKKSWALGQISDVQGHIKISLFYAKKSRILNIEQIRK